MQRSETFAQEIGGYEVKISLQVTQQQPGDINSENKNVRKWRLDHCGLRAQGLTIRLRAIVLINNERFTSEPCDFSIEQ